MFEETDTIIYKLRYVIVGLLVLISLFMLSLILSTSAIAEDAQIPDNSLSGTYDSPNAVTSGMFTSLDVLDKESARVEYKLSSAGTSIVNGVRATGTAIVEVSGNAAVGIGYGFAMIGKGAVWYFGFVARMMHGTVSFIANTTANIFGLVSHAPVVSAVITPGGNGGLQTIEPYSPTLYAAEKSVTAEAQAVSQIGQQQTPPTRQTAVWPLSGQVTTLFGVPHWPWQPVHTGIDISSGQSSGAMPIKPYKPGRVVETITQSWGLGNHVIVDHGEGITSVYAHLSSIAVVVGQEVTKETVLGHEGSTGASTGTHLHFEVRVNGEPTNPHLHIHGNP